MIDWVRLELPLRNNLKNAWPEKFDKTLACPLPSLFTWKTWRGKNGFSTIESIQFLLNVYNAVPCCYLGVIIIHNIYLLSMGYLLVLSYGHYFIYLLISVPSAPESIAAPWRSVHNFRWPASITASYTPTTTAPVSTLSRRSDRRCTKHILHLRVTSLSRCIVPSSPILDSSSSTTASVSP